jgi:hypothetical protein
LAPGYSSAARGLLSRNGQDRKATNTPSRFGGLTLWQRSVSFRGQSGQRMVQTRRIAGRIVLREGADGRGFSREIRAAGQFRCGTAPGSLQASSSVDATRRRPHHSRRFSPADGRGMSNGRLDRHFNSSASHRGYCWPGVASRSRCAFNLQRDAAGSH